MNKSDKKTELKNLLSLKKEKLAQELREFYPVTYGQEALFFIDSYRNDAAYNVISTIHLQGRLNVEALKKSIECIIKRHAVFRTIFLNIDGTVYQKISDEIDIPFEYYNFLNAINADERISHIITAADNKLFDLNKLPLVRFLLIQKSVDAFLLHFVAHHIVWDGWSGHIFIQELAEIYNAFSSGREADLPPLNLRYVDFAINQKQKSGSIIERQQDYWKGKLSGYHGYLNLPERSINQINKTGITHNFKIADHLYNKISQLAKDNNTSLYSVLVANFYLLMYWMTGQKDICFGQPINIRDGGDYDKLIGYFVNVIPLRIEQNAQDTISALLANIRNTLREGFQNKDVPFEQIVNLLNPQRKDDVNPIFQSIISLTNLSQNETIMNGLNLQVEESEKGVAKVDLTLGFILSSNGLSATFECNPARFSIETIKFLASLYCELCENSCSAPQQSIGELLASDCSSENIWLNKTNENEYPWWFRGINNRDVTITRKSFVDTLRSSDVEELARLIGVESESIIFTMYALLINFLNGKMAIGHASIKSDCEDTSIVNFQFATLDSDNNIQGLIKQYEKYIASVRGKNIYKIPQIISANQSVYRGSAFYFSDYEGTFSGSDAINESLIVKCEKSNSQYRISLNVSPDHFYPLSIRQIEGYWRTIIEKCLALDDSINPTFIGDEERQKLLIDWNNTAVDYPKDKCIHELFEAQVGNNPDAVAVIFESEQLTYGELNQQANQLAHYLINEKQVKPDTLVGICVERSLDMVVGILAILKSGGAYVPLDPEYPEARLKYMLDDAQLTTVLTQSRLRETTPVSDAQAVCLDDENIKQQLQRYPTTNVKINALNPNHLVYVIYTSGSMGNPKGVLVGHQAILNLAFNIQQMGVCGSGQCWGWNASYAFDASLQAITQLMLGSRLQILSEQCRRDPSLLANVLGSLDAIDCTPMMAEAWFAAGIGHQLPHLVLGGEPITPKLWSMLVEWQHNYTKKAINVYGPTECAVDSTGCVIGGTLPHIGKALPNTTLYVMNPSAQLVGQGLAGELHIGGVGLARGYLNRADLTAEKFIANPFYDKTNSASSERLYKTGDLVRWLPDGNLEYVGRIDHQVKIRGFRIELGEIENTLISHADVKDAVVVARESLTTGDKHLVAYVVSEQEQSAGFIEQLRHHLGETLPDYMVPSAFVLLEKLPLNPNGKVDRKALPEPDISAQQNTYVAPRTETEKILCDIWQEVLGVERVGITDNFFKLGGHSLLATRLISRINQTFTVNLPLKSLFNHQTLERLAQAIVQLDHDVSIPMLISVSREQELPASYAQQRLWLLDQIDGGSAHYNISGFSTLSGVLHTQAINQAFNTIIERHESVRTCFAVDENGQPVQVIQSTISFAIPVVDLSETEESSRQLQLKNIIAEEANRVFDLSRDLMLRAQLIKVATDEHILLVTMHHIASDGWSMSILINEFSALYSAYVQGNENPLTPLTIQYADYAHWQRNWLQGEVLDEQLQYWTTQLANLPVVHSVPLDYARPAIQRFAGATYHSQLDEIILKQVNTLCQSQGATLFMGLHAAFSVLLSRYSNETDIVIGSPIANREQAEVANLIGFFINTLVLRSDLSENPSFIQLINKSKTMLLDAYAHQQVPFEQIVERLQPERSLRHSALFQIMLVLQNNEQGILELPGLTLSPVEQSEASIAKYDLTLNIIESEQRLQLSWEYNTDLFGQQTIARMANHFGLLLNQLLIAPDENVFKADMLSAQERQQLLVDWNDTQTDYPKDKCIHELFEAQVETNPDAIAVVFEDQQLTYQELNDKSNQLAHYLINEKHIKPDTLVGICVERSLDMVIGILAILKAGGAYVPLDPEYPEARFEYMLDDAKLTVVLTQSHLLETTPVSDAQAICLDNLELKQQLKTYPITNPDLNTLGLKSNHLAYVIYTSGSTGSPKGVMIQHSNTFAFLSWAMNTFSKAQLECVLASTSMCFDLSIFEMFAPLSVGGSVLVVKNVLALQNQQYFKHKISLINTVPSAIEMLLTGNYIPVSVNTVNLAGEPLKQKIVDQLYANDIAVVYDLYGPSEDTTYSTFVMRKLNGIASIGKPIENSQVYVVNPSGQLVGQSIAGELLIGGAGLARGYLNRPDLTAEKFIANPFYDKTNPASSERLYKTGDLVRWLPDGNIEYLGRIDHQVKIRGFRIELGEIENTLISHADVKDVVVVAKESPATNDKRLIAYVVTEQKQSAEFIHQLRQHVNKTLPDYMLPSAFVLLEKLPLNPNGKVDRKALPEPDISVQQNSYVAPQTEMELLLSDIWQEVLGVERVGITDNFFQLGGHSLLIMQVIARLQKAGLSISVRQLFNAPRLVELAEELERTGDKGADRFIAPENLVPQHCKKLRPEMLTLINLDQASIDHIESKIPGGAENIQEIYSLGPLQEGILYHHMMSDVVDPYVLTLLFKVESKKVIDELVSGLQCIINRHDILRTAIVWDGLLSPVQVVCREAELPVEWIQFKNALDLAEGMEKYCQSGQHWINLTSAPLLELKIGHAEETDTYFAILLMHHIVADHVGIEIIQKEFFAYQTKTFEALPPSVPYREFIAHVQHQSLHNDANAYFSALLNDLDEPTLPFNISEVNGNGLQFIEEIKPLSPGLSAKIRSIANKLQVRAATLFHVVWSMVLSESSGKDDIVFGSVMSGRLQGTLGIENALGAFVNTLPLRVNLNNKSTLDFVKMANDLLTELMSYEYVSPGLIKNCSALEGGQSLITTIVNYRHTSIDEQSINDRLTGIQYILGQERTNYPFVFCIDDFGRDFSINLQVDRKISVKRVLGYVETALNGLIEALELSPEKPIKEIGILPALEKQQLLIDFNQTACEYPKDACIHELFEAQVGNNPDAVAVIFEEQKLTYSELNKKANQLAHYLINEKQVTPDALVGICVERSLEMVVGILAILKAGGAYVPLDPEYPEARLKYMLDDAQLTTVLTQSHLRETTPVSDAQAVCLDDENIQQQLHTQSTSNPNPGSLGESGLTSNNLAYVIYTSGSTGNPKGVMVEHTNVVNFLTGMRHKPGINAEDCLLAVTSTSFDIHGLELFLPLVVGAKLIVSSREATGNPELLFSLLRQHHVSLMQATPATWKMLLDSDGQFESPLKVLCGGEALSVYLATALLSKPKLELWNMYGPTETTIWSATQQILPSFGQILMGQPIANTQIYIATNTLELAPIGVAGELLIGGAGVTRGYLNRSDLTAEKFIANPFFDKNNPSSSERLYKTGDLVRWLPDGHLEFLGRIDHQVKIRGFRIELGEIENTLSTHASVKDVVVVAKESVVTGDKRLVGYVVVNHSDRDADSEKNAFTMIESFRQHLRKTLPDYMVPSAFVLLEHLPLTPNGKVDRKALPEPDMASQQQEYIAPRTPTEKILCEIWQEILGVERVGVTDNFFTLGGHSLLVIKLVLEIEKEFNTSIKIKNLLTLDCLGSLSDHIDAVTFNPKPGCSINDMEFFEI